MFPLTREEAGELKGGRIPDSLLRRVVIVFCVWMAMMLSAMGALLYVMLRVTP